jgi:hypothetical protein
MHAIVGRSRIGDFEQARKFLREEAIPRLSQIPGFVSGHWVKLDENTGASLILFESEEAAQQAAERFQANPAAHGHPDQHRGWRSPRKRLIAHSPSS